ncbi:sulfurtransferase [Ralstonia solanacearum]|uniref:Sulfurtransferase n=1 Tax=Ralstonia solanacearum K60 TaxID=1091042 RepID=A0AAP7ZLN5_RALSL|nr:rhodanese-like domain-containing protein [Ralstonia solanacearum]MBT1537387.1 sulfurtransferase [Ralstonia solanacearum]OYQ12661.1 sulfurtransferase [Ralstonia solanacearum K60]QOK82998.1 sulfurtransferase [Ralstonia solanacearum]RIJ87589.1 sulfurtransferase [Ralstonia solanacearum]CCF96939.1 putative thiosulfate sulfurtransferase,Rhodanese-like domain (glpE) [Ralstonia solanacearum K60]
MQQLAPTALAQWLADASRAQPVLLDVRETGEVQICALPGITHIPMGEIPHRAAELDAEQDIVCICHHGGRSMQVAQFLIMRAGFDPARVYNLQGGVDAWARQIDPQMATY